MPKYENAAIILAGGTGKRAKTKTPKQFISICGKTLLEWSLSAFDINKNIATCNSTHFFFIKNNIGLKY